MTDCVGCGKPTLRSTVFRRPLLDSALAKKKAMDEKCSASPDCALVLRVSVRWVLCYASDSVSCK